MSLPTWLSERRSHALAAGYMWHGPGDGLSRGWRGAHEETGPHLTASWTVGAGSSFHRSGFSSSWSTMFLRALDPSCGQSPLWAPRPVSPSGSPPPTQPAEETAAEGSRATCVHWGACPCVQQAEVAMPGRLQALCHGREYTSECVCVWEQRDRECECALPQGNETQLIQTCTGRVGVSLSGGLC